MGGTTERGGGTVSRGRCSKRAQKLKKNKKRQGPKNWKQYWPGLQLKWPKKNKKIWGGANIGKNVGPDCNFSLGGPACDIKPLLALGLHNQKIHKAFENPLYLTEVEK